MTLARQVGPILWRRLSETPCRYNQHAPTSCARGGPLRRAARRILYPAAKLRPRRIGAADRGRLETLRGGLPPAVETPCSMCRGSQRTAVKANRTGMFQLRSGMTRRSSQDHGAGTLPLRAESRRGGGEHAGIGDRRRTDCTPTAASGSSTRDSEVASAWKRRATSTEKRPP